MILNNIRVELITEKIIKIYFDNRELYNDFKSKKINDFIIIPEIIKKLEQDSDIIHNEKLDRLFTYFIDDKKIICDSVVVIDLKFIFINRKNMVVYSSYEYTRLLNNNELRQLKISDI